MCVSCLSFRAHHDTTASAGDGSLIPALCVPSMAQCGWLLPDLPPHPGFDADTDFIDALLGSLQATPAQQDGLQPGNHQAILQLQQQQGQNPLTPQSYPQQSFAQPLEQQGASGSQQEQHAQAQFLQQSLPQQHVQASLGLPHPGTAGTPNGLHQSYAQQQPLPPQHHQQQQQQQQQQPQLQQPQLQQRRTTPLVEPQHDLLAMHAPPPRQPQPAYAAQSETQAAGSSVPAAAASSALQRQASPEQPPVVQRLKERNRRAQRAFRARQKVRPSATA